MCIRDRNSIPPIPRSVDNGLPKVTGAHTLNFGPIFKFIIACCVYDLPKFIRNRASGVWPAVYFDMLWIVFVQHAVRQAVQQIWNELYATSCYQIESLQLIHTESKYCSVRSSSVPRLLLLLLMMMMITIEAMTK